MKLTKYLAVFYVLCHKISYVNDTDTVFVSFNSTHHYDSNGV